MEFIDNIKKLGPYISIVKPSRCTVSQIYFILEQHSTCFYPFIIRSLRLYIQHNTIRVLWVLASKQPQNLYDICLMLYVQSLTPDDGTEKPSETCVVLFQNKINLRCCASDWLYYRNILRCTVLQMSDSSLYVPLSHLS